MYGDDILKAIIYGACKPDMRPPVISVMLEGTTPYQAAIDHFADVTKQVIIGRNVAKVEKARTELQRDSND